MNDRPILVTGAQHSGTTWAGRMLSLPWGVGYIHEPFDPTDRPGTCRDTFERWYTFIDDGGDQYKRCIEKALRFHYDLRPRLKSAGARGHGVTRDILGVGYQAARRSLHRWAGSRPLMKDPLALLSAEWLADTFDMDVVLIVRHPAAFADSLRRRENSFPFEDLVEQEMLVETILCPYRAELRAVCQGKHSIIEQASLLWKCLNHAVVTFWERHPDWTVVRYKDLAGNPREEYSRLYRKLSLTWTERIGDSIEKRTSTAEGSWKNRLNASEVEFVKECTSPVWEELYVEKDW